MDGQSDKMAEPAPAPISITDNLGVGEEKKLDTIQQDQQDIQQQQQAQDDLIDDLDIDVGLDGINSATAAANGSALASAKLSSKKKEALSQVPCKFFRSNGCSAGNACPFAHTMPGEGQGKAVCQWFLKGSCRFGHRCALAHILPGQPMSMDRKNKRAAQQQQGGMIVGGMNGGQMLQQQQPTGMNGNMMVDGNKRFSGQRSSLINEFGQGDLSRLANINFVPSEFGPSGRQFAGDFPANTNGNGDLMFGMPDDLQNDLQSNIQGTRNTQSNWPLENVRSNDHQDHSPFDGLPMPVHSSATHNGSLTAAQAFGTSPFSHPGSHSVFYSGPAIHDGFGGGNGGVGRSDKRFGSSMGGNEEDLALRAAVQRNWDIGRGEGGGGGAAGAVDDEHAEEFLPSSLSDLLTPAELERRRKSVLASKNATLSKAMNGGGSSLASQSMPAHGIQSRWNLDKTAADSHLSPELDPIVDGTSSLSARIANRSLLGSSNVTNGFLSTRLQSDLARSRDAWKDSNEELDQQTRKAGSYSPSVQAVLSHAPGQSLPQGLAAGLSRMHLRSSGVGESTLNGNGGGGGVGRGLNGGDSRKRLSGTDLGGMGSNGVVGNGTSPGVIGGPRSSIDELGPTAPSSIFNQRGTSLHHFGRSIGANSISTSLEAGSMVSKNSPFTLSPAMRAFDEKAIAIPASAAKGGEMEKNVNTTKFGSVEGGQNNNQQYQQQQPSRMNHLSASNPGQHPGIHRVRGTIGGGIGASPLSLPTTGEEVEEAIFELE